MKRIRIIPRAALLACIGIAAPAALRASQDSYTLSNDLLSLEITASAAGNRPGEITSLRHANAPLVDIADDGVFCGAKSGDFIPREGTITGDTPGEAVFRSTAFFRPGSPDTLPLTYECRYRLADDRILITVTAVTTDSLILEQGLELDFNVSRWTNVAIGNHYRERNLSLPDFNDVGILDCHTDDRLRFTRPELPVSMDMKHPNPAWSRSRIRRLSEDVVYLKYFIQFSEDPYTYDDPNFSAKERICSVFAPGDTLYRDFEIRLHTGGTVPRFAFSPHPDGYDQTTVIMWDDIAHWFYAADSLDNVPGSDLYCTYLLKLLGRHPDMKMTYLVTYDAIWPGHTIYFDAPADPHSWNIHSYHRLAAYSPEPFRQWLRDVENENSGYWWSGRMHLGTHAYHHERMLVPGDISTIVSHEFSLDDPEENNRLFTAILKDMTTLGLTVASRRSIRYPGFKFSRAALEAAAKSGHVFYDNGKRYNTTGTNQFHLSMYKFGSMRIWGMNTCWWADYSTWPDTRNAGRPYSMLSYALGEGKTNLVGGHPYTIFNYAERDSNTAGLHRLDSLFTRLETDYPHMGYLYPEETAAPLDALCGLRSVRQDAYADSVTMSFAGALPAGITAMLMPGWKSIESTRIFIDGVPYTAEKRNGRLVCVLPALPRGNHRIVCREQGIGSLPRPPERIPGGITVRTGIDGIEVTAPGLDPGKTSITCMNMEGRTLFIINALPAGENTLQFPFPPGPETGVRIFRLSESGKKLKIWQGIIIK